MVRREGVQPPTNMYGSSGKGVERRAKRLKKEQYPHKSKEQSRSRRTGQW